MKRLATVVVTIAAVAVLSGCNRQTDPPSPGQVTEQLSNPDNYFEVTRPDGTTMWCNRYGEEGAGGQSWFAYDCDWSGRYDPDAKAEAPQ